MNLLPALIATVINIGPPGETNLRVLDFNDLNGTVMQGQTLEVNLRFSEEIHLFPKTTNYFLVGMAFQTDQQTYILGTGSVLDEFGSPMGRVSELGSASSDLNEMFVGLFPLYDTGLSKPLTFFGLQFDLQLPNTGSVITRGNLHFFDRNLFRVGAHVADTGLTVFLLFCGLLACFFYDSKATR